MGTSQRIPELDALRGIAALLVVGFHYTTKFGELYGHPQEIGINFSHGHFGVQLFFCISGFVIAMTLDRTSSWMDFVVSRFSRLYPSFWVAVATTFLVVSILGLPGKEVGIEHVPANLTMVPNLLKANMVDGVYWTLQVELFFYIIMLLLHLSGFLKHIHAVSFVWLGMQAIYLVAKSFYSLDLPYTVASFLILPYISFFTIGIVAYQAYKFQRTISVADIAILLFANAISSGSGFGTWLVHCMCVAVFIGLSQGYLRPICVKPLLFAGTISYALYLLHENIGWAVMLKLYALGLHPAITILGALLLAIILSWLLVRFVEQPAMRKIRHFYKSRERIDIVVQK